MAARRRARRARALAAAARRRPRGARAPGAGARRSPCARSPAAGTLPRAAPAHRGQRSRHAWRVLRDGYRETVDHARWPTPSTTSICAATRTGTSRRVRVPVPGRHRRRRARDPRPPVRLAGEGVVGAAGRRHGGVRPGRARALPGARRSAPEVTEWLSRAVKGWVGRVSAARRDGRGWFVLDTIAGELPEELARRGARRAAVAAVHAGGGRRAAGACPAPGWTRARCAAPRACRSGWSPRPATLSLVESYGEPRFKLDVNWDPDTSAAFVELPAAEAHGRTRADRPVPARAARALHPRVRHRRRRRTPCDALAQLRDRARRGDRVGPPLARRRRRPRSSCEDAPGRRAAAVPARRRALRARVAAAVHRRRAGAGQDGRGARRAGGGRRVPRRRHLPGVAEAQLAARDRALAAAPLAARRGGHRQGDPEGRHHRPQLRDRPRAPRAALDRRARRRSSSTSRTTSRTRRPSARAPSAGSPRSLPEGALQASR